MRKIRSQSETARGKRVNQIVVGVILIGLLVVSTLGYSLMDSDSENGDRVNELGVDFVRDSGLWKIDVDGVTFGFQYLPSEVSNVFISGDYNFGNYSGEVLYFVNANEGTSEVLNNLGRYILRYQSACLRQAEEGEESREGGDVCDGDLPIKDCNDNLIIFEPGNETMVWMDEGCVYIVGDSVRGADAFLYKALKIS